MPSLGQKRDVEGSPKRSVPIADYTVPHPRRQQSPHCCG